MSTISKILSAAALFAASLLRPAHAHAELLEGLGRWSGTGIVRSPEGKPLGEFRVELTRSSAGPGRVETQGTVTTGQGHVVPFRSLVTRTPDGFTTESARGKGHATCVDPGVCHSYELDPSGNGSTTTILVDSVNRVRILVTELEKGKPVRLVWQTLSQP
jgi:hypothetical protein